MTDEGLHEVQLNGKQLVFLFMVGTVVAVVIFLCGVMVGRGIGTPRQAERAAASLTSPVDPTAPVQSSGGAPSTPTSGTPVSTQEALTYAERLGSPTPVSENFLESEEPPKAPRAAAAVAPPPASKPEPAIPADLREPRGNGFVVQVMAVTTRAEADTIARRLSAKGYPTFVTTTGAGTSKMSYRVRVGKYDTQREAEAVSARLQKEEQFKPWVTR